MSGFLHGLRMSLSRQFLFLCLLALASASAWAARPMTTDDARIVDTKACQVESWVRVNRQDPNTFWAIPGCSPVENLELSWGGAQERQHGQTRLSDSLAQGKLVLRPLKANDWGLALTLGRALDRGLEPGNHTTPSNYLNVPLSFSRRDDAVLLHLNLGLRNDRLAQKTHATWGAATELQLRPGLQFIAESHGESGSRAFLHGGLRYWLVPDRVQLDATYGTEMRAGTSQRWISFGVRLLTPAFLP